MRIPPALRVAITDGTLARDLLVLVGLALLGWGAGALLPRPWLYVVTGAVLLLLAIAWRPPRR